MLSQLLDRLFPDITQYKQTFASQSFSEYNDIPFNSLYQNMISGLKFNTEFVSIILHIDGVSLCKSSKLTLWLLSGIFIELPPLLRYQRCNMILLSMWIAYNEPVPKFWLSSCFDRLYRLKTNGKNYQYLYRLRH